VVSVTITPERREALEKFLDLLVRMNELGLLDTLKDLMDPELIGRLSELVLTPGTMKLLDRADDLLELAGSVNVEDLKRSLPLVKAALEALAREPKPVGLRGLLGALRDPDVQRGLGLAIEVLRAIGKATRAK
jgi:uncharacterized protein YjgD (DUF1641 family)